MATEVEQAMAKMGVMRLDGPGCRLIFPKTLEDSAPVGDFYSEFGRAGAENKATAGRGSASFGDFFSEFGRAGAENKATAGRGIVKAASWSDFETRIANRPDDTRKVAVAEGGVAEGGAGKELKGKKKLVKVMVSEEYIRALKERPPRKCRGLSDEMLLRPPESQEEEDLRACILEMEALTKAAYDKEMNILHQFDVNGYAEIYVEEDDM